MGSLIFGFLLPSVREQTCSFEQLQDLRRTRRRQPQLLRALSTLQLVKRERVLLGLEEPLRARAAR